MLCFLIRMSKEKKQRITFWILIAVAMAISAFLSIRNIPPAAGKYQGFAKCIANTSTTFYGAFWCPHCQSQKREFGDAAQYLPYVECSASDASGQTQACINKNITEYPTWYFPDGSSSTGEQSLQTLSKKTGCPLPTST